MASGIRKQDETYEKYRERMKEEKLNEKRTRFGTMFWDSRLGTYRKSDFKQQK